MKVFRKNTRELLVNQKKFICLVDEGDINVKMRIYSGIHKSSFVEITFEWGVVQRINLYKPNIMAKIISHLLDQGWDPFSKNQILRIEDGLSFIEKRSLG
ncbi:hypothetical protein DNH61_04875 [Paenibacillus sambharensis]|uniref:Uncharacterized protein n=1 Tax=Paenibacillus sambharensis TaxID=1803190 RepID=A0A2W1LDV9_9BACL|nr:hypothetical protein [Paenibacillus sambharensis]PZD96983.1 hypothetical protein DNH61_04875 [Paenibacillus sambharensis]